MAIWKPTVPVESNRVLELNRSNPLRYTYTLPGNRTFPTGTSLAMLTISNTFGLVLGAYSGTIGQKTITFYQSATLTDLLPRGASWTLKVTYPGEPEPTMLAQGTVVRTEAPFPDQDPANILAGVTYSYQFATPGLLRDASWRVLSGTPVIYNNTTLNMPNAVAAGAPSEIWLGEGESAAPWSKATMLYYAPLPDDAVSMSYNVVTGGALSLGGETWVIVCSSYDMNSCVAFFHKQAAGDVPQVGIAVGSGPTTGGEFTNFDIQASVDYTTNDMDNFIATYNPITNAYALWKFGAVAPLVTWTDAGNVVLHGPGFRYAGFAFESGFLAPGVEIANWYVNPNVTFTDAAFPEAHTFVADTTYQPLPWAKTIDLIGVGAGGGGNGENLIVVGFGGFAGVWGATTLTVGDTGPTGIKAGTAISITVGEGGTGGPYFSAGEPGESTVFSWVDAANAPQSLTAVGGAGGNVGTSNPLEWGLSPGNLTFKGVTYEGGAIEVIGGLPGNEPGGGGTGGAPFQYGADGARGQAWIVEAP